MKDAIAPSAIGDVLIVMVARRSLGGLDKCRESHCVNCRRRHQSEKMAGRTYILSIAGVSNDAG